MRAMRLGMGLILLGAFLHASAQVVECVDANGKKTYAQSCPNATEKKRDITTPNVQSNPGDKSWKTKDEEYEKLRQKRIDAEKKDDAQQQRAGREAQQCADARRRLDLMESGRQAKRVDPVTGEHVPMDDSSRQAELEKLREQIQQCDN